MNGAREQVPDEAEFTVDLVTAHRQGICPVCGSYGIEIGKPSFPADDSISPAVDVGGGLEISEWPDAVRLYKPPKSKRVRIAPSRPAPGFEANWENETRVYVPASQHQPSDVAPGWLDRSLERAHRNILERPERLKPERYKDPTNLAPGQGGRNKPAGKLPSDVEGEARALAAKRLRQAAGPRTDAPINVPVAVQNLHAAADLLSTQPDVEGLVKELEDKADWHEKCAQKLHAEGRGEHSGGDEAAAVATHECLQLVRKQLLGDSGVEG